MSRIRSVIAPTILAGVALLAGTADSRAEESGRVEQLEQELEILKERLDSLEQREAAPEAGPVAEEEKERGIVLERRPDVPLMEGRERLPEALLPAVSFGEGGPSLQLRGFSHVQYDAEGVEGGDSVNNFAIGGVDLFITSQITERVSFLNETVFEFGEEGENILDVERVLIRYEHANWLNATAGRGHTPLGYWNQHYHHGTWLQTTTDRPIIYRFEDDGGILPVHFVGLELDGTHTSGLGTFTYEALAANGRGRIPDSVQLIEDMNEGKQFVLLLREEPSAMPGLGFGIMGLYDEIPPNFDIPGREINMREAIFGGHFFYLAGSVEVLVEGLYIRHKDRVANEIYEHGGGYAQLAYAIGKVKPYYRFDILRIDPADPFYWDEATLTPLAEVEDQNQHTFGVRWDAATYLALKVEYRYNDADSATSHAGTVQASFAF